MVLVRVLLLNIWLESDSYKTPEKYRKKNIHWKDIPKEEKIDHSAYRWYRSQREQELNKAKGKKKARRPKKKDESDDESGM